MYRVLIADDEPIERIVICKTIERIFKDQLEIVQAVNGREAIELFEESKFHIAILDIEMPGINGIEAAVKIREYDKKCNIIFLTAMDDFKYAKKAITVKALEYLLKPSSDEEIIAVIEEAIRVIDEQEQDSTMKLYNKEVYYETGYEKSDDICISVLQEEILKFIRNHYLEGISMQDAAEAMNYSNAYFCKLFRQCFNNSRNVLPNILPNYSYLSEVVKVIAIEDISFGKELNVLMNGDLQKAIAYLGHPSHINSASTADYNTTKELSDSDEDGWKWRHYMAEQIAKRLDMDAFLVKGIYLFGSTNNGTARLNSDIDLLIHFDGNKEQKDMLNTWLHGWSVALSELNYIKTGYKSVGLLDIHYITDKDIIDKTSYAIKIDSIYDPAYPLRERTL